MSGHRDFDRQRFTTLATYILARDGWMPAERLAWLMFHMDFGAYAQLGQSLTGATYLKRQVYPQVAEMGDGWFEQRVRTEIPWWARAAGWLVAAPLCLVAWRNR